jgi:hypothetical protein
MDNMKITSKYNEGENVWFFEQGQVKFFEGTINEIQSWDKWSGFRYDVKHVNAEGQPMNYNVEESKLYTSKDEILANLFEANGVEAAPAPAPVV